MDGGLGGGNGFMFRTRRNEDAEVFVQEWQGQRRPRRASRVETAVAVGVIAVLVVLGLMGWLG